MFSLGAVCTAINEVACCHTRHRTATKWKPDSIKDDINAYNMDMRSAIDLARDKSRWRNNVSTSSSPNGCMDRKNKATAWYIYTHRHNSTCGRKPIQNKSAAQGEIIGQCSWRWLCPLTFWPQKQTTRVRAWAVCSQLVPKVNLNLTLTLCIKPNPKPTLPQAIL